MNYTVTNDRDEPIARCKHVEDAAALVALQGDGARIVYGKSLTLWIQGRDGDAGESFDAVADEARFRIAARALAKT